MKPGWKKFMYKRKTNAALDGQFDAGVSYGRLQADHPELQYGKE